ncbi:hypothetical protein AVEN_244978-1 [Araneus ventricosus]|uniref:Uncharacterized protein n=1 Tax=Araneus ventricosus TaxID=182803 RepID=A0A4Y2F308_ARAVE|nr:hypothetical protein AVEN_244978-1 [Araneus ventricosus]
MNAKQDKCWLSSQRENEATQASSTTSYQALITSESQRCDLNQLRVKKECLKFTRVAHALLCKVRIWKVSVFQTGTSRPQLDGCPTSGKGRGATFLMALRKTPAAVLTSTTLTRPSSPGIAL